MALRDASSRWGAALLRDARPCLRAGRPLQCRSASSQPLEELESNSSLTELPTTPQEIVEKFDPVAQSKSRKKQLPPSRYEYRSPRYYRGPLHPHQPPPPSDPASREFIPGPFSSPRLEQTYNSTIAPDIMTLAYTHFPPGYVPPQKSERLRTWQGDSPYFKNRPKRGPRGGDVLRLLTKPITFRNIPKITGVTIHSMQGAASSDSGFLHVAGMVIQAISNVRVEAHKSKKAVVQWGLRKNKFVSVTAELKGEDAYHFLSKTIELVLPRIKEWRGVKGSSGDNSGNIAFGLRSEDVQLYPEIEVNYDMYPPRMIPGCDVIIHTSATNDREARLLLNAIGLPFYGKLIN